MALTCIILNEISQTQRATYCMVSFLCHPGKGKKYQDREEISGGQLWVEGGDSWDGKMICILIVGVVS